jgi:hypothetical protein
MLFYNQSVHIRSLLFIFVLINFSLAQQPEKSPSSSEIQKLEAQKKDDKTQIRLNVLHVCSPDEAEKQVLSSALTKVPHTFNFSQDFELIRGVATMKDSKPSRYLRLRRELAGEGALANVLYSISTDNLETTETLVLKTRDIKELISLSFDVIVTASSTTPASLLTVDSPPTRIRVERSGKNAVVLARCESGGQEAYDPLFHQASSLMSQLRSALGLRGVFKNDIAWLSASEKSATSTALKKGQKPVAKLPSVPIVPKKN